MRLFEVSDGGVRHLVAARSEGHAKQVVTKSLHVRATGLEARLVSDMAQAKIIRSDYPED